VLKVTDFRRALETVDRSLFPEHMRDFPFGCCSDVSDLLASYLNESGLGEFELISASRTIVGSPTQQVETHAWLTQGKLIIDITADQFIGNQAVIVVSSSRWHDTFRISERRSAGLESIAGPVRLGLDEFYKVLLSLLCPIESG